MKVISLWALYSADILDQGVTHAGQCGIASCFFQLKTGIFHLILSDPCLLWVTEMAKINTPDNGDSVLHTQGQFSGRACLTC